MDPTPELKQLFQEAVELEPEKRAPWLDQHCPDPALRRQVEDLLEHHDVVGPFPSLDALMATWAGAAGPGVALGKQRGEEEAIGSVAGRVPVTGFAPGAVIGDFEILRELGRGGMGVVYLARELSLDRFVALKMLPPTGEANPGDRERLRTEAQALARLEHPAIVPIFHSGELDGHPYLVMPYVEGTTLHRLFQSERAELSDDDSTHDKQTERARVLAHVQRVAVVAEALDHSHKHDIVHRDVKPANILLDVEGNPHLTDFGIARLLDRTSMTVAGSIAGSCRYMSPEQASAASTPVDARSDVFSLGVVLYEALTLAIPFDGKTVAQVLNAVMHQEPKRVRALKPSTPRDLATICHKALEKRPLDRYQTASHMAADLRTYVAGGPILARPPSAPRRALRWTTRHRLPVLASLLTVSLLAVVGVLADQSRERSLERFRTRIVSRPVSGSVYVQRFDPVAGRFTEPVPRGETPVQFPVDAGQVRITVVAEGGRFAETTWRPILSVEKASAGLRPGDLEPTVLDLLLLAPGDVPDGLVTIPAGTHVLGRADLEGPMRALRDVRLPDFAIGAHEVSFGEYRAFLRDSGRAPPLAWPDGWDPRSGRASASPDNRNRDAKWNAGHDALPVVGVRYVDAEAYAAWHGLRLPSADEWEAAARWPDGRLLPWGSGLPPVALPATTERIPDQPQQFWDLTMRTLAPVAGSPELSSAAGLEHTFSNVSELTSTLELPGTGAAMMRGGDWRPGIEYTDLTLIRNQKPDTGSPYVGFRCARSVAAFVDTERRD